MSTVLSLPKKILHSRIFSFLCIKLYISGKEDSNERNPSGVSFVFIQVGLSKNEVFRQAGHRARKLAPHKKTCGFANSFLKIG